MEKSDSAMKTGISEITGKIVRVRHANEQDLFFIEEMLKAHGMPAEKLDFTEFVIAAENDVPIGCGRIRTTKGLNEISCVEVVKEQIGNGVDSLMVEHLLEFAPMERVYAVTDHVEPYKRLGFREVRKPGGPLDQEVEKVCRLPKGKERAMIYEKKGSA